MVATEGVLSAIYLSVLSTDYQKNTLYTKYVLSQLTSKTFTLSLRDQMTILLYLVLTGVCSISVYDYFPLLTAGENHKHG